MKNTSLSVRAKLVALTVAVIIPVAAYAASLLYQAAPPVINFE